MDIIIPVYNSLQHAYQCIVSVLENMRSGDRLIVVDDASRAHVAIRLRELVANRADAVLLTNPENLGYLQSVVRGLEVSSDPLVMFLNSDTLILPGTLDQLETAIRSDDRIGVVNPVSNWANWSRVSFPRGQSITAMQLRLKSLARPVFDIHNASGFCMLVSRSCLDTVGGFDLAFDPGYWEETDLCLRARAAGYRVVCDPSCFVPHHGWASFGEAERNAHMARNRDLFLSRWQEEFERLESWFRSEQPLAEVEKSLQSLGSAEANVAIPSDRTTVLYLLNGMKLYGGVISVLQLVNQLILRGIEANVAVFGAIDESMLRNMPMYFRPMVFESEEDLVEHMPRVDLVVATHWATAFTASRIEALGKCRRTVYFCQDFEPEFYPEGSELRMQAEVSYHLIEWKVCKTDWLRKRLLAFGPNVKIIPLGLNVDEFSDFGRERTFDVISMARPDSTRRNWEGTKRVYERLLMLRPSLRLAVYGFGMDMASLPEGVQHLGMLSGSDAVAEALNRSVVLLDASLFQGFGRPGLEAMACGTAAVLTRNGGITSYATHMKNSLLIDPLDEADAVEQILLLLDNEALRTSLVQEGRKTAENFSWRVEGERTASFFGTLLES